MGQKVESTPGAGVLVGDCWWFQVWQVRYGCSENARDMTFLEGCFERIGDLVGICWCLTVRYGEK